MKRQRKEYLLRFRDIRHLQGIFNELLEMQKIIQLKNENLLKKNNVAYDKIGEIGLSIELGTLNDELFKGILRNPEDKKVIETLYEKLGIVEVEPKKANPNNSL